MKNLMIAILALFMVTAYAQDTKPDRKEHRKELGADLSPEQTAELSTKKMTLHLDLNESQQKEINKLELERAKKRKEQYESRENRKNLTDTDRFDRKNEMLDAQITHKKKMKSILTEEQYTKWQSERHSKKEGRHKRQKHSDRH